MKKSKIIVPALGILLLSTAASVSGTVAWFTAVRNFTANVGDFAVVKTTADLKCDFAGLVGTTESKSTGSEHFDLLSVDSNAVLTDGSFDHTDEHAAYPVNSTGNKFAEISTLGFSSKSTDEAITGVKRGVTKTGSKNIFTLFTWTMTFHYESETSFSTALFFNLDAGQSSATASTDGTTKAGFRIAFVNQGNGRTIVWAPFRVDGDTTELTYVSSVNGSGVATETAHVTAASPIGSHNCITSSKTGIGTMSSIEDGDQTAAQLTAMTNYIGTFTPGTNDTLVYHCAAWYEGTDSAVESDKTLATISTVLSFDARIIKAA